MNLVEVARNQDNLSKVEYLYVHFKVFILSPMQSLITLSTSAVLVNTVNASPAYSSYRWSEIRHFPQLTYKFDTIEAVTRYWAELELQCSRTPLNRRKVRRADEEEMITTLLQRRPGHSPFVEPIDFDKLTEDDLVGVAGLPWQLFAHLARNWASGFTVESIAADAVLTVKTTTAPPSNELAIKARAAATTTTKKKVAAKRTIRVALTVAPTTKFGPVGKPGGLGLARRKRAVAGTRRGKASKEKKKKTSDKNAELKSKVKPWRDTVDYEAWSKARSVGKRVRFSKFEERMVR